MIKARYAKLKQDPLKYEKFKEANRLEKRNLRSKNPEKFRLWERTNVKRRYSTYKKTAKNRKLEFNLTFLEFESLVNDSCHYCGCVGLMGIDRVDNLEGYSIYNTVPCCKTCNLMKRNLTVKEFVSQCKKISG